MSGGGHHARRSAVARYEMAWADAARLAPVPRPPCAFCGDITANELATLRALGHVSDVCPECGCNLPDALLDYRAVGS